MSWLLTLLGIIALIVLHELGHFLAAKAVGMRVERFSLFFPPKLFGVKRGETEYMVGVLPFGGYVKITGMSPEEIERLQADSPEPLDPDIVKRAYYNQPPWKRIVVILAGPGVNLLIAFLLFWVVLVTANLNGDITLANLNPSIATLSPSTGVQAVEKGMPAEGHLKPGDRIVAVDGHTVDVTSAMHAIEAHRCAGVQRQGCRAATPVTLTVRRGSRTLTVVLYPRYSNEAKRMLVGVQFAAAPRQLGVIASAGVAGHEMFTTTTSLLSNVGKAFTSEKVRHQFHSIVGITVIAQEAVAAGAGYALVIIAFVSLALAVINLFPFLPLDGGHVLWALAEKVRRRRVSAAAMWRFSSVGIVLLLFLVINGFSNDISHLAG